MKLSEVAQTPEQFVEANGLTLCWQGFGRAEDPVLLLIMGMGAPMTGWEEVFCRALAARGYFVLRYDARDTGRSTHFVHANTPDMAAMMTRAWLRLPIDAPYRLIDMANDAAALLDALDIERAHVVGASMGGAVAQTLAIHQPQRVATLTSIMSTTGDPGLPRPKGPAVAAVMRKPARTPDGYIEQYVSTWRLLRVVTTPDDDLLDRARAHVNLERGLVPGSTARHMAAILASGSRRNALSSVAAPTLVIHGELDPLVPLAAGIDTAHCVPGSRLMVLPEMGHALPLKLWPTIVDAINAHAV